MGEGRRHHGGVRQLAGSDVRLKHQELSKGTTAKYARRNLPRTKEKVRGTGKNQGQKEGQ